MSPRGYLGSVPRFSADPAGGTPSGAAAASGARRHPDHIDLTLRVPAEPSALNVVRQAIGGVAAALDVGPAAVADVRLAVTEAATTAIRRSDGGAGDTIEVRAELSSGALRVTVSDRGHALPISGELPLPLVAAISDAVELTHLPDGGTSVAMTFRVGAAALA